MAIAGKVSTMAGLSELSKSALLKRLSAQRSTLDRLRHSGEQITAQAVGLAVGSVGAFGASYFAAKTAGGTVKGVPVEILAAAVLYGGGMTGLAGNASHYLTSAGAGALYAWVAKQGAKQAIKAPALPAPTVARGEVGPGGIVTGEGEVNPFHVT